MNFLLLNNRVRFEGVFKKYSEIQIIKAGKILRLIRRLKECMDGEILKKKIIVFVRLN